jgi:molybdopterin-guanine dinucleotide biosynthesis protein B
MVKLVEHFAQAGYRVGTIKHSCHPHPLDVKGKDSWRHKEAGAERTLFVGPERMQLVADVESKQSPVELAGDLLKDMELVLVEGFLQSNTPKIEVVRSERSLEPVSTPESGLLAIVSDIPKEKLPDYNVPCIDIDDIEAIAEFIKSHLSLEKPLSK